MSVQYDYAAVRTTEWDTTNLGGGAVLARICPVCAAHVPAGNNFHGVAYRELHTLWHEGRIHPTQEKR